MKVGVLSTVTVPTPPPKYGGAEKVVYLIAKGLAERGHEVTLFGMKGSRAPPGATVVEHENPDNIRLNEEAEMDFLRQIRRDGHLKGLDVLHSHTWAFTGYQQREVKPVISTFHGICTPQVQLALARATQQWKRLCMVGVSHTQASTMMNLTRTPFRVALNGIDVDEHPVTEPASERYFVYASRVCHDKGTLDAVQACAQAKVHLKLVGGSFLDDGDYVQKVRKLCEEHGFEMHGQVSREKWNEVVGRSVGHVFPLNFPWMEPFGLVVTEAGCMGVPTITTPNGAMLELIRDGVNGWVVESKAEMSARLRHVAALSDDDMKALRTSTVEASRHWSYQRMAARYEELYEAARVHPW